MGRISCRSCGVLHVTLHPRRSARGFAVWRSFRPRSGAEWEEFGVSVSVSAREQRGGDEQQHGRDEQQRDDELDLRARPWRPARSDGRRASERASAAWAARVVRSGAPWRSARSQGGDAAGCGRAGSAPRGRSSASIGRLPHVRPRGRALELARRAGRGGGGRLRPARAAARARRRSRPAAGRARRAARLSIARARVRGAPAQRVLGREIAGDGGGEQQRERRAGRARRSRAGARRASVEQREAGLERDDLAHRTVEPRGGDACREAAGRACKPRLAPSRATRRGEGAAPALRRGPERREVGEAGGGGERGGDGEERCSPDHVPRQAAHGDERDDLQQHGEAGQPGGDRVREQASRAARAGRARRAARRRSAGRARSAP